MDAGRRLPMWMMGAATAADPVAKNSEFNNEEHEDERVSKGDSCGRKKKNIRNFIGQDGDSGGGVIRSGGKRKNSLLRVVPRKDRTNEKYNTTGRKRKSEAKASSIIENGEEIENDEDLTMEDLTSIAEEEEKVARGSRSNSKGDSSRRKKKKRNFIGQDGDSSGRVIKNGGKEKTEHPPRKPKSKAKASGIENGEEIENDEDLTMEDLMSIAKEYVKEDEYAGTAQSSSKSQSEETSELRGSCTGPQSARIVENEESIPSCGSKTKEIVVEPNMSGDPTQDMLDLFLGPLLKRTREEEKNTNLITEEMSFAYEIKKQNRSVVVREVQAPLTKKKSSLKDKTDKGNKRKRRPLLAFKGGSSKPSPSPKEYED
ncbi:uncharacterized protein Fot_14911 [Forsythia ovata]|uniref:Uncharacterized protein n=1 Tax=Forsythia ovata TaxID=205694 RepID=A0ABD1WA31_9LAMI